MPLSWARKHSLVPPLILLLLAGSSYAASIGQIEVKSVSPRVAAQSPSDVYDEVASGLNVVGIGEKVYLEVQAKKGQTVTDGTWSIVTAPGGSTDALSATTGTLVTLRPTLSGLYVVQCIPSNLSGPGDIVTQRIYAGKWNDAGVFDTHATPNSSIPHCGNACCHSENADPRLNIVDSWIGTNHANKLQKHLGGQYGPEYAVSCLPCHTLGFNENPAAVNNGFDDIAAASAYDLNNIVALVADAGTNHVDNWPQLPSALQMHSSIQCESCHGPGSNHLGNITENDHGIAGVTLDPKGCAVCHDSQHDNASGLGQGFYQWSQSGHPITDDLSEGSVATNTSCVRCHTGEGYIEIFVNHAPPHNIAGTIPPVPHGATCATCHDPHGSDNQHALRRVGDLVHDSGFLMTNLGKGGACAPCHQSRVASVATSINSSRGSHYGAQSDVLQGISIYTFGLPIVGNSAHTTIVPDSCVTCHMAKTPDPLVPGDPPPAVGEHTYAMVDETTGFENVTNACGSCHSGLGEYNREARGDYDGDGVVEGIQTEVHGLFDLLYDRGPGLGMKYWTGVTVASHGYLNITTAGFNLLPVGGDKRGAFYNYNLIWKDGSFGIHNTSLAIQTLQRSYYGVYGHTITDDYPNIDLRGPVQPSVAPTPTPTATPVVTPTPLPTPVVDYLAEIDVIGISPRVAAQDAGDIYDEPSSGLKNVGVGEKMFLKGVPKSATVTGYQWSIYSKPSGSTAALSSATDQIVSFRPDRLGTYVIRLKPTVSSRVTLDTYDLTVYAANFAGAGVFDTHASPSPVAPQCGTSFCHGGSNANPNLNVEPEWIQSKHAQKLQNHLNGLRGPEYSLSCLPCHTTGFNTDPQAVNNGFDDIATNISFDLNQIVTWADDAATNHHQNFPLLPAVLQDHASIQCENCHGAGSTHPANLTGVAHGIDGVNLDTDQCARCHDSQHDNASGLAQGFYQWSESTHPITDSLAEGRVETDAGCIMCHTGEGFVTKFANNRTPAVVPNAHGVTCSACHDPHFSNEEHQLRVAGDFVLPSGARPYGSGTGGLCFRCHNSRVVDAETTSQTSYRGAHHGPQADMLLGSSGVSMGLAFNASSPHGVVVPESCAACHMAATPAAAPGENPPEVGGHTFSMRDTKGTTDEADDVLNVANACQVCHASLTSYDYPAAGDYDGDGIVEGTQTEVSGLFTLLQTGIMSRYPGVSIDPATGKINITSSGFAAISADQKRALYNFNFCMEDGSKGVHNTSYTVQLLQRSYYGVFGMPINQVFPGIYLLGPVQPPVSSPDSDKWAIY